MLSMKRLTRQDSFCIVTSSPGSPGESSSSSCSGDNMDRCLTHPEPHLELQTIENLEKSPGPQKPKPPMLKMASLCVPSLQPVLPLLPMSPPICPLPQTILPPQDTNCSPPPTTNSTQTESFSWNSRYFLCNSTNSYTMSFI